MTQDHLTSHVNAAIAVRVMIAITVFRTTALAGRFIIGVVVDVSCRAIVPEGFIKVVLAGAISFGAFLS